MLRLRAGLIAFAGCTADIDNCVLAVTGGTGRYQAARGSITITTPALSSRARLVIGLC